MIKYKVWDKQNKEFWPDIFTAEALARSHRFPENLEDFYEIIPLKRALEIENMKESLHGKKPGQYNVRLKTSELPKWKPTSKI